jgi:hypothetical protein
MIVSPVYHFVSHHLNVFIILLYLPLPVLPLRFLLALLFAPLASAACGITSLLFCFLTNRVCITRGALDPCPTLTGVAAFAVRAGDRPRATVRDFPF